jgi:8-oxo-dGTP diphosphatase
VSEGGHKRIRVVAALVEREGRYLITQRRKNAVLPLLWEFPGGRVEDGEKDADALAREMRERLDAVVEVGKLISYTPWPYEHYTLDFYLYECRLRTEELVCKAVNEYRWVTEPEFDDYQFTPVDEASMNKLLGET